MGYKNLIDCHSHSNFSRDGKDSVENMCQSAYEKGIKVYAITDHCECDLFKSDGYEVSTQQSLDKLIELKKEYKEKMKVLVGIELGQPLENTDATNIILSRNYDYVIGSLHRTKGLSDYYFINYKGYSKEKIEKLLKKYFEGLLDIAKWNKFDTLAHLTYPLRYIKDSGIDIDISIYDYIIEQIFKTIIKNKKAIEVNTSGLRQSIKKLLPDYKYIKMYKDLGGEYITIGSDSHNLDDVCKGIQDGLETIKQAGFEYITYFENREAKFLKIE